MEGWLWRAAGWSISGLPDIYKPVCYVSAHSEEPQCLNFPLAVLPQDARQVTLPLAEHWLLEFRAACTVEGEGIQITHKPHTSPQPEIPWHKQTSCQSKLTPSINYGVCVLWFPLVQSSRGMLYFASSRDLRGLSKQWCWFSLKSIAFIMAHV